MSGYFKSLLSDRVILYTSWATFFVLFAQLMILSFAYRNLPPLVPLYNQLPWGDVRLADKNGLFFPFGIAVITVVLNVVVSHFYLKQPLILRFLFVTSFLVCLLVLIFTIRTVQLVL